MANGNGSNKLHVLGDAELTCTRSALLCPAYQAPCVRSKLCLPIVRTAATAGDLSSHCIALLRSASSSEGMTMQ